MPSTKTFFFSARIRSRLWSPCQPTLVLSLSFCPAFGSRPEALRVPVYHWSSRSHPDYCRTSVLHAELCTRTFQPAQGILPFHQRIELWILSVPTFSRVASVPIFHHATWRGLFNMGMVWYHLRLEVFAASSFFSCTQRSAWEYAPVAGWNYRLRLNRYLFPSRTLSSFQNLLRSSSLIAP